MLSQEFPLPEVLRIWDSILSDETRWTYLTNYNFKVCLTIQYSNEFNFREQKLLIKLPLKNSVTNSITISIKNSTQIWLIYRSDFLLDVCTAMLTLVRKEILSNEFPDNMKLLQVTKNYYCWYKQLEEKVYWNNFSKPFQECNTKARQDH